MAEMRERMSSGRVARRGRGRRTAEPRGQYIEEIDSVEETWAPRTYIAEFIGTFFLCFGIIAARGTADESGAPAGGLVGVALVHTFVLAAGAAAFGPISGGHFNPAVTLAFVVTRQMNVVVGLLFWLVQFVAGVAAGGVASAMIPAGVFHAAPNFGVDVSDGHAFLAEFLGTFFLVIVVFSAGVSGAASHSAFLAIGVALGVAVLFAGPISNACVNPARALGAAVASPDYDWDQFWLYIIAPLVAGLAAAILWGAFFQKKSDASMYSSILGAWTGGEK